MTKSDKSVQSAAGTADIAPGVAAERQKLCEEIAWLVLRKLRFEKYKAIAEESVSGGREHSDISNENRSESNER